MCSTQFGFPRTVRCIICYEDTPVNAGISCASGHAVCNGCFGTYLHERAGALGNTELLASKAETAELLGDAAVCRVVETDPATAASAYATQAETFAGRRHCPLRGHGCTAPQHGQSAPLGSAPARLFRLLSARLAALGGLALPE